jgi:hypothetical protein
MSAPDIPTNYTMNTTVGGHLDMDLDEIHIKELPKIVMETAVKELPKIVMETAIKELPKILTESRMDLGLDNIRVEKIAPISLELGMKPTRISFPMYNKFCLSFLGLEVLTFSVCGESMIIIEPYVPRETERCD